MKIKFYGVRGSAPAPGKNTCKYGGNTSCIHIELDDKRSLVFDAGTGLRELGKILAVGKEEVNLVVSHGHWDHIQGYPFFIPIYQPERLINIFTCAQSGHRMLDSVLGQMDGQNFPLKAEDLLSHHHCYYKDTTNDLLAKQIQVVTKALNHPGGGAAYKVIENGMSVAYVTDNELDPPYAQQTKYHEWVDFLHGTDVLIHDAQYTEDDMPHKHGWGHSLISQVRQLAVDAQVGSLVMFHHDPDRTDGELDEIQIENEKHLRSFHTLAKSICAMEGMEIELSRSILGGEAKVTII